MHAMASLVSTVAAEMDQGEIRGASIWACKEFASGLQCCKRAGKRILHESNQNEMIGNLVPKTQLHQVQHVVIFRR